MKSRIIVAALLVPLLLVVMLFTPDICFAIVVAVISAISAYELLTAAGMNAGRWSMCFVVLSSVSIPICVCLGVELSEFIIYCLVVLVFMEAIAAYQTERQISFLFIVMVVFAGGVIPVFLSALVKLNEMGEFYALLPFVIAFLSDAGAFFVGLTVGKRKLMPTISPKKTVEGSIGGFFVTIIAMIVYGVILNRFLGLIVNYPAAILYAVLGSAVTQLGDLAFSLIKRELHIKDFGKLLGEHGGMLDRFDSMVFVAPLVLSLVEWIPVF